MENGDLVFKIEVEGLWMEDYLGWKTTFDGTQPLKEDYL